MLLLPFPATIPGERKSYPLYVDLSSGKVYVTDPLLDQKVPWLGIVDVAFDVNDSDLNALVHLWRELHGRSNPIPKHRLSGRVLWYDIIKTLEKQVDQLQDIPAREFNTREKLKHVTDAKELPTPRELAIAVIDFFKARELRSRLELGLERARSDVASLLEERKASTDNAALEKQVQHLEEQIQRMSAVVVPIPNVDKLREQIQTLHVQNRDLDQQVRREQLRFNLQRQIAFSKIPATDSLRVQELQKQQRALQSELDALLQKINAEEAPVVSDYERVQAKAAESAQKRIQTIHQYQTAVAKQEEAKAAALAQLEHERQQLASMNALREQKLLEPNEVAAIDAELQNLDSAQTVLRTPGTPGAVSGAFSAARSAQSTVSAIANSVKGRTPIKSILRRGPSTVRKSVHGLSPVHAPGPSRRSPSVPRPPEVPAGELKQTRLQFRSRSRSKSLTPVRVPWSVPRPKSDGDVPESPGLEPLSPLSSGGDSPAPIVPQSRGRPPGTERKRLEFKEPDRGSNEDDPAAYETEIVEFERPKSYVFPSKRDPKTGKFFKVRTPRGVRPTGISAVNLRTLWKPYD